jgi:hypothetical protein
VRIGSLELSYDLSPVDWIVDCIHDFAVDVGSIIPEGFEAYARLFHPAIRIEHGEQVAVRWTEIAATRGRTTHPEMQWANISGVWEHSGESSPGLWDLEPDVGSLPRQYADHLTGVLARYTSTPDHVWFAVWDGFGGLKVRPGARGVISFGTERKKRRVAPQPAPAPKFELPNRSYFLMSGPIEGIGESMCEDPFWQSANLWWPEDRARCVATEIDFAWTYIAGDRGLVESLTCDPALEALSAQIDQAVTFEADLINPPPARP